MGLLWHCTLFLVEFARRHLNSRCKLLPRRKRAPSFSAFFIRVPRVAAGMDPTGETSGLERSLQWREKFPVDAEARKLSLG